MQKINTIEEVASRLKAKEDEINRRVEAIQDEVKQTRQDVAAIVKANPWIGVIGTSLVGVLVGLAIGKKSQKQRHKELVDNYVQRLSEMARNSGASEEQVGDLLREALRDTIPQVVYSVPKNKSVGFAGKLFGMATDIAFGYLSKTLMNTLESQLTANDSSSSEPGVPEKEN